MVESVGSTPKEIKEDEVAVDPVGLATGSWEARDEAV